MTVFPIKTRLVLVILHALLWTDPSRNFLYGFKLLHTLKPFLQPVYCLSPQSWVILIPVLMGFAVWEIFSCEIRALGLGIRYSAQGIWNPLPGNLNLTLSWIPWGEASNFHQLQATF